MEKKRVDIHSLPSMGDKRLYSLLRLNEKDSLWLWTKFSYHSGCGVSGAAQLQLLSQESKPRTSVGTMLYTSNFLRQELL